MVTSNIDIVQNQLDMDNFQPSAAQIESVIKK